ncbi:hypothetical protein ACFL1L_03720 [Thermoplasmatota archaeon]
MKIIIFALITVFLLIECIGSIDKIIIDDYQYQNAERDPVTINNIQLIKDIIRFNVSYGGGCEDHIFKLISTSFMESNPVQVNIVLSHEDNDDPCDMWITETYTFNISPLKESYKELYNEETGSIIMNIEGYNEPMEYSF